MTLTRRIIIGIGALCESLALVVMGDINPYDMPRSGQSLMQSITMLVAVPLLTAAAYFVFGPKEQKGAAPLPSSRPSPSPARPGTPE